jgi:hypothetical protein
VPAQSLNTDAFVLLKRPPKESFQTLTVFSAEHGALTVLQRVAQKSATAAAPLDLFDEASLMLESSNQARTWFVREVRVIARPGGIARHYEALQLASEFTALLARNPVHEDSRAAAAILLRTALAAFATGVRPDAVFFKSLYCFARDEGYPVKQQWLATLPNDLQAAANHLLRTPLASLEPAEPNRPESEILRRRLTDYLRAHTEILFD